jgi:hypothetical protein
MAFRCLVCCAAISVLVWANSAMSVVRSLISDSLADSRAASRRFCTHPTHQHTNTPTHQHPHTIIISLSIEVMQERRTWEGAEYLHLLTTRQLSATQIQRLIDFADTTKHQIFTHGRSDGKLWRGVLRTALVDGWDVGFDQSFEVLHPVIEHLHTAPPHHTTHGHACTHTAIALASTYICVIQHIWAL